MSVGYNMRNGMKKVIIAVVAIMGMCSSGSAQILSRGDLFGPGALPPTFGVELGLGLHREEGNFQAICECTFEDGKGSGLLGALTFNLPLDYEWSIGIKAGIDFKNFATTAQVVDVTSIRYAQNDSVAQGRIRYQRNGDIAATYFTVAPAVKYQFFRGGPFVQAAAGISFLMSSKFTHTRELMTTSAELLDPQLNPTGQVVTDVTFQKTGTREETLEDGEIPNIKGLRLGILLTGGYDIPISDKAIFSPMLTYDFPLSTVRDDMAENWKISTLLLSVGLKYLLD